jgi:two-component sensor histidine kinase
MKLKSIKPGDFYLTKPDKYSESRVIKILGIVEERVRNSWRYAATETKTTKKLHVARLSIEGDGTLVEIVEINTMAPHQILCQITEENAMGMLRATVAQIELRNSNREAYNEYHEAMVEALTKAGFTGAVADYRGITFSEHAVARWAESQS